MASFSTQRGMSLISLLVAIGILGIVMTALSSYITSGWKASQQIRINANKENLRNYLRMKVSCRATFDALGAQCSNQNVAVLGKNDEVIVAVPDQIQPVTEIGDFHLMAKCETKKIKEELTSKRIFVLQKPKNKSEYSALFTGVQLCELVE